MLIRLVASTALMLGIAITSSARPEGSLDTDIGPEYDLQPPVPVTAATEPKVEVASVAPTETTVNAATVPVTPAEGKVVSEVKKKEPRKKKDRKEKKGRKHHKVHKPASSDSSSSKSKSSHEYRLAKEVEYKYRDPIEAAMALFSTNDTHPTVRAHAAWELARRSLAELHKIEKMLSSDNKTQAHIQADITTTNDGATDIQYKQKTHQEPTAQPEQNESTTQNPSPSTLGVAE